MAGMLALLSLFPFTLLFPVFWGMDAMYRQLQETGRLFASAADIIGSEGGLDCLAPGDSPAGERRRFAKWVARGTSITGPLEKSANWTFVNKIVKYDLPLLRDGFAIAQVNWDWDDVGGELGERVYQHCRDQRFLANTEPLDIYPDFKQALLAAQRDLDAAMARYESSRPWILLVMWGWALFELVGCYWGLKFARQDIRRWKHMRSRGKPDQPAPS